MLVLLVILAREAGASLTTLHSFAAGSSDGSYPQGPLTLYNGNVYGMTTFGGSSSDGVIFSEPVTGGSPAILHSFLGSTDIDGSLPYYGNLTLYNGNFYGMTFQGGSSNVGEIFSEPVTGGSTTTLHSFAGSPNDGKYPYGSLTLYNGNFYGMTSSGGCNLCGDSGVIFTYNIISQTSSVLYSFTGYSTDGIQPKGSLLLYNGNFYGMTYAGGSDGEGVIFSEPVTGGSDAILHNFVGGSSDGRGPDGSLIISGNVLYGMTEYGGSPGDGVIFSEPISGGSDTLLHAFTGGSSDGSGPYGSLILFGNTLYGMTYSGGTSGDGVIFSEPITGGSDSILYNFTGSGVDGANPYGSLILSGYTLYGMTSAGGSSTDGIVFSYALPSPPFAATANSFTLSNTIIDVGQVSVANTAISGGSFGPYSGQWTWINANGLNNQLVNTLNVGFDPYRIAFNPQGSLAYLTMFYNTGTVNVINPITGAANTIPITTSSEPYDIAINPSGSLAYVTMYTVPGNVDVINTATNSVINSIVVGDLPTGVAFNNQGTLAYVAISNHGYYGLVNVINVATNTVVNSINVGQTDQGLAVNPSGTLVYVATGSGGGNPGIINVISTSTNQVVNSIYVGTNPYDITFNPSGTLAYVTMFNNVGTVNVINTATNSVVNTIVVGGDPVYIAINPSGTLAYVTERNTGAVNVIDLATNTVIATNPYGYQAQGIAMNPQGTLVYAVMKNDGTVNVIGNLSETSLQTIPYTSASGQLQLTVNAFSANTLYFAFNGVTYTESTGSNTVYGQWSLYGFAQDNGINIYYYGSNSILMSNTITIDPALTSGNVIRGISNGQTFNLVANATGGAPPYSYQWYSGSSSTCTSDSAISGATSAAYAVSPASSTYYCYKATDSATTPEFQYSNTIQIIPAPPTVSNSIIEVGQITVVNAIITGGSNGPYSGQWSWTGPNQTGDNVAYTLDTGSEPRGIAINPRTKLAYVVNWASNTVSVFNTITNSFNPVNTISLGQYGNEPYGIAINPQGTIAYVTNENNDFVSVINLATNTVTGTIFTAGSAGVVFNPSGTLAYTLDQGSDAVRTINVVTSTVVNTITMGSAYFQYGGLAINPSGSLIYVNQQPASVVVINTATNTIVNTITTGGNGYGVAFNPSGTLAYEATQGGIYVINVAANTVLTTIGGPYWDVSFNPSGTLAYGTCGVNCNTVNVIDVATNAVINTVITASYPWSAAVATSGNVYVTNNYYNSVSVIANTPQTGVLPLQSNNALQLIIDPTSSNTLTFTFNGVTYTRSAGTGTLYGQWSLYGFAQDNGTNAYYYGSNTVLYSNTITIVPDLTAVAPAVPIAPGPAFNIIAQPYGGQPPYTYQWYSGSSSTCTSDTEIPGATSSSNVVTPTSPTYYCYKVTDSTTNPSQYSPTVEVVPQLPPTLSNTIIDVGQISVASANAFGGSGGPYSGQWSWFNANGINNQVVNIISLGGSSVNPSGIGVNPRGTVAYVTIGNGGEEYDVLNLAANSLYATVGTASPVSQGITFTPSGAIAYLNSGSGKVFVLNAGTNAILTSINTGYSFGGYASVFNPSSSLAYVSTLSNILVVINVASNSIVNTITVGGTSDGLAINPKGTLVYAGNEGGSTVNVINTTTLTVVNTINVGSEPISMTFNPQGTLAYVLNYGSDTVSTINTVTNTVVNTIYLGILDPTSIAVNPSGTFAYVAGHQSIVFINLATNSVASTIETGLDNPELAINPSGSLIYISNFGAGTVNVIGATPGTGVQSLASVASGATLPLTINAASGNTIYFTLNGVQYTETTGSNTLYGKWNLYGFAQDNGTNIYYYGSNSMLISNILSINPALGVPPISPSASGGVDIGQTITFNSIASGGTGSYSYNFIVYNSVTHSIIASSGPTSVNGFAYMIPAAGNTLVANVVITDTGTTTPVVSNSIFSGVFAANSMLMISLSPASNNINAGQSVTFTNTVTGGTPPYSYAYVVNSVSGVTINGNVITFANPGTYNVLEKVTDNAGYTAYSSNSVITVNTLPSISITPSSTDIDIGHTVTFTNTVTGGTPPYVSYSYSVNSLSGVTIGSNAITFANAGTYNVLESVTDSVGDTAYSSNVMITVNSLPSITITPSATHIDTGQTVTFTNTVSGGTLPYTAYSYTVNSMSGVTIGSNAITFANVGTYNVLESVTDSAGYTAYSTNVVITVNSIPSISITPSSTTIDAGQTVTFTNTVSGGTLPYTAYSYTVNSMNGVTIGSNAVTFANGGTYNVLESVTDSAGYTAYSSNVMITVNPTLSISLSPSIAWLDTGQTITFTNITSYGTPPYTYSYTVNSMSGVSINGNSITFSNAGTFNVLETVTDHESLTAHSQNSIVYVQPLPTTPSIAPSTSQDIDVGQTAAFAAYEPYGTSPYTYNFLVYNSVTGIQVANMLSASNTFQYVVPGSQSGNTLYANVFVTDNALVRTTVNSIMSGIITVSAAPLSTPTISPSAAAIADPEETVDFAAFVFGGTGSYTYNFLVYNSVTGIVVGNYLATSNTFAYIIPASQGGNTLYANVIVSDGSSTTNSIPSGIVTVTPSALSIPTIAPPSAISADPGQNVIFASYVSGGTGSYTYNFLVYNSVSGAEISNLITAVNAFSYGITASQSGNILNANVFVNDGAVTYNSILSGQVSVANTPSLSISPSNAVMTSGQYETYTIYESGGTGPFAVMLYNVTGSQAQGSNIIIPAPGNNGVVTFQSGATGTFVYNAVATDEGTYAPFTFNSVQNTIVVQQSGPTTTVPCSGSCISGSGGSGSGAPPASPSKPVVTTYSNATTMCNYITNFTQDEYAIAPFYSQSLFTRENYVTPSSAGISIDNASSFDLDLNSTVNYTRDGVKYSIGLYNVSYLPIIQTVKISMCTPLPQPVYYNVSSGLQAKFNVSSYGPAFINSSGLGMTAEVKSSSPFPSAASFSISNYTGTIQYPAGLSRIGIINLSYTADQNVSVSLSWRYLCSLSQQGIEPYIYANGTWTKVDTYNFPSGSCAVSFSVPPDPIVALFYNASAAVTTSSPTTIAQSTTAATSSATTSAQPTTTVQQSGSGSGAWYWIAGIIAIAAALAAGAMYLRKRKKDNEPIIYIGKEVQEGAVNPNVGVPHKDTFQQLDRPQTAPEPPSPPSQAPPPDNSKPNPPFITD